MYEAWLILPVKVKRVLGICKLWWVKNPLSTPAKKGLSTTIIDWLICLGGRLIFSGVRQVTARRALAEAMQLATIDALRPGNRLSRPRFGSVLVTPRYWLKVRESKPRSALDLGKFHRDLIGNSCHKGGYRLWNFCVIFQELTLFQYFSCDSRRSNGRICNCKLKILWCLKHFVAWIVDVSILPISCWVSCSNCLAVETCHVGWFFL